MRSRSTWHRFVLGCILLILLLLTWQAATPAQDSYLSSRVSRLESENSTMRSRLSRLESEVARLNSETGIAYTEPLEEEVVLPSAPLSSDPMFDRLATLAIELKERIVALEAQVADLQARVPAQ